MSVTKEYPERRKHCYYPLDEGWPGRASVVHANPNASFAWDYPYDDYFTYKGGLNGTTEGEPFNYMLCTAGKR